jgi:hypothetical protein
VSRASRGVGDGDGGASNSNADVLPKQTRWSKASGLEQGAAATTRGARGKGDGDDKEQISCCFSGGRRASAAPSVLCPQLKLWARL